MTTYPSPTFANTYINGAQALGTGGSYAAKLDLSGTLSGTKTGGYAGALLSLGGIGLPTTMPAAGSLQLLVNGGFVCVA